MIRRVHHEKLDLLHTDAFEYSWQVYRSRVTGDDLGFDLVAILFVRYMFLCSFRHVRVQINPDSVAPESSAFDQRRTASRKRVEHPIVLLGVTKHELMWNLRDEITPVPAQMRASCVAFGQHPEAVGDYVGVLFPTIQIDVVDLRCFDLLDSTREAFDVVARAFDRSSFEDLIEFGGQDIATQNEVVTV